MLSAGTIDYQEFLAGTISLSTLNKRENLLSVFEQFDKDNSGYLTIDELEHALTVLLPTSLVQFAPPAVFKFLHG